MTSHFSHKVRAGVIWSLVQNWGARLGSLLVFMLLARILSPAQMGLFAAATTVVAFCSLFVDSGLSEAVVQVPEVSSTQLSSVFIINLTTALLVMVGLWFSATYLAAYFKLPDLVWILRVSSLSVLLNAMTFSQIAMFRRAFEYKTLAVVTLGGTVLSGAVAVAMALYGYGSWSLVAQALIAAAYTALMLWLRPQWHIQWGFDLHAVKGLLSYGSKRLVTALMDFANTRLIELFFASLFGAATLGLYVVGARVYQILIQVLCSAVLDIAHNAFSRLAHEPDKLREAYYSAMGMASATSMPIFFLLSFVSPELTLSVFGKQWAGAAMVMTPLLMLGGVQVLQFFNGILYNAIGRPGIALYFVFGKTIVTVGILYMVKDMCFAQVIWAYFISQIISTPVSFYVAKRVMGISFRRVFEQIWPFALATFAAASVVYGARALGSTGMPIADLVVLMAVGGLTYLLTAVAVAKERVRSIINTLRNRRAEAN